MNGRRSGLFVGKDSVCLVLGVGHDGTPATANDLLALGIIRNGENSGLEFKRDDIQPRQLAKELVAFANLVGGRVLLGVEDDGTVSGITRDNIEEWVMTVCRDKIRPEIIPYFELIRQVEPGKDVAVVRVEPGYAVHNVWHESHRTYYVRVGTTCREASPEELERHVPEITRVSPQVDGNIQVIYGDRNWGTRMMSITGAS